MKILTIGQLVSREENGTLTPAQRDLLERRRELEKELNDEERYRQLIKSYCVWCLDRVPGTWTYYKLNGNCCQACHSKNREDKKKRNGQGLFKSVFRQRNTFNKI